jgi:hypothetical protein
MASDIDPGLDAITYVRGNRHSQARRQLRQLGMGGWEMVCMTFALSISHIAGSIVVDMCIDYASTAGAYCSPTAPDKILLTDLTLYDRCLFRLRRRCCGSHSSIAIGQEFLNHVILFIAGHMADVIA